MHRTDTLNQAAISHLRKQLDRPSQTPRARILSAIGGQVFGEFNRADIHAAPARPLSAPVLILAGSCNPARESAVLRYEPELAAAFEATPRLTLISGGTAAGVAGLAGTLKARLADALTCIGYLPHDYQHFDLRPESAWPPVDRRYDGFRYSAAPLDGFSVLEPLTYWGDILASAIPRDRVGLILIDGGTISEFEVLLAAALGARVLLLSDSGELGMRLERDEQLCGAAALTVARAGQGAIQAFLHGLQPDT